MLTLDEIVLTVLCIVGIFYNAFIVATRNDKREWYGLYILCYALFVLVPMLVVTLYALSHFVRD